MPMAKRGKPSCLYKWLLPLLPSVCAAENVGKSSGQRRQYDGVAFFGELSVHDTLSGYAVSQVWDVRF